MYIKPTRSDELYHHGILGQKWGVRRYQNEDGSLTSAGRRRFNKVAKSEKESERVKKDALHTLNLDLKKSDKKYAKATAKFEKTNDVTYEDKAKKYLANSKDLKRKIKNIETDKWKAGQEYCTINKSMRIPYAYVGLTGPKVKIAHIPKHKVVVAK